MPLRITLKPYEHLIINGASIRNGGRNAAFLIETKCKFLRESEIISESEADTPCKKLCVTLQVIHLADDPAEAENLFFAQAIEVMRILPSSAPFLLKIQEALAAKETYTAIKFGRKLMYHEAETAENIEKIEAA